MTTNVDSKVFSLIELNLDNNKKDYLFIFRNYSYINILKFNFQTLSDYKIKNETKISNSCYIRILSSFIMDNYIYVFFLNYDSKKITYNKYDFNLNSECLNREISGTITNYIDNQGIFFKALHLKENYITLVYYTDSSGNNINNTIGKINGCQFDVLMHKNINGYQFSVRI